MAAETEEKLKKYNEALHEARVDGYKLLEKERAEGLKAKDEAVRLYREEVSREVQNRIENTRRQEESVKKELEAQAGAISSLISAQILRRPTQ
jgi:F0F1-type ATP synthase membrane subunit b/b'